MADKYKRGDAAAGQIRTANGRVVHDFEKTFGMIYGQHVGYRGKVAGRKRALRWNLDGKRLNGNRYYNNEKIWNLEMDTVPAELKPQARPLDKSDKLTPESRTATATE